jgi:hypothetical protein
VDAEHLSKVGPGRGSAFDVLYRIISSFRCRKELSGRNARGISRSSVEPQCDF